MESNHFYTNAVILTTGDRDAIFTFRLLEPNYDEENNLKGTQIADEIKVYLSIEHLESLYQVIKQNLDRKKKKNVKKQ
jgi:hypothetical protein